MKTKFNLEALRLTIKAYERMINDIHKDDLTVLNSSIGICRVYNDIVEDYPKSTFGGVKPELFVCNKQTDNLDVEMSKHFNKYLRSGAIPEEHRKYLTERHNTATFYYFFVSPSSYDEKGKYYLIAETRRHFLNWLINKLEENA